MLNEHVVPMAICTVRNSDDLFVLNVLSEQLDTQHISATIAYCTVLEKKWCVEHHVKVDIQILRGFVDLALGQCEGVTVVAFFGEVVFNHEYGDDGYAGVIE